MKFNLTIIILISLCILGLTRVQANYEPSIPLEFGTHLKTTQGYMKNVYKKSEAIARCEGYYAGNTRAWRNNNPGNIKRGGVTDDKNHSIFSTRLEGWSQLHRLLLTKYKDQTPIQMNRNGYAEDKNWHKCVNYYLNK